jgi:hypothetical protein
MLRFGGSRAVQDSNEGRTGSGWKQSSQQPPPCLVLRSQTRERARTLIAKVGARTASTQLTTVLSSRRGRWGRQTKHNKHKKRKRTPSGAHQQLKPTSPSHALLTRKTQRGGSQTTTGSKPTNLHRTIPASQKRIGSTRHSTHTQSAHLSSASPTAQADLSVPCRRAAPLSLSDSTISSVIHRFSSEHRS